MTYHTTKVVGFPPHRIGSAPHRGGVSAHDRRASFGLPSGHSTSPLERRWSPNGATPPTFLPHSETGVPNPSAGVSLWVSADLPSARWRRHRPFNYGCSLGQSARRRTVGPRGSLRPSFRSSFPVPGPGHVRPATEDMFSLPRTMLKQGLQGLKPYETAESGSADTPQNAKIGSGFLPRLKSWVSTLEANL